MSKLIRFTSLKYLIPALEERKFTLRSPDSWEDKNDRYPMQWYRDEGKFKTVLAICFTTNERFNHWITFSKAGAGIAITFDKDRFVKRVQSEDPEVLHDSVEYKSLKAIEKYRLKNLDRIPFIKRAPYRDEHEYRFIFRSKDRIELRTIPFEMSDIKSIRINPWADNYLVGMIKERLQKLVGDTEVRQTSILENKRFIDALCRPFTSKVEHK